MPTTDSVPSRWNNYRYDKFNRRTSTRYASGKVDSCAYGALTDTIIENGIRRIRKYDAKGLMTQAMDPVGSIAYYYRPDGREITKEYDSYGRITKQITPDLTTVYTYDDTENTLLSAVSNNGSGMRNTYDEYVRLKTQREEAPDGKWLQKTYSYSADGLPTAIAYTSQAGALTTEQLSYRNGCLTEVRLADGTLVYRHDEENALGQLTKLTSGEMQRSYAFNDWGLPVRRSISRTDHTVMFDYRYRFNAENNNLLNRTDETRGLSEDFSYDELNRLSTYGNNAVDYDNQGNIRWKGDAGELVYTNPNRPYTVTGLTPAGNTSVNSGLDITYTAGERPSVITQGIGAAVGMYSGGVIANKGQYNPAKWNWNSGKTWGYMFGGAVVGGVSGYVGFKILHHMNV